MSRNRSKTSYVIRKHKKRYNKDTGLRNINTRAAYKAQSIRKITPSDYIADKGFVFYAKRSGDIHGAPEIRKQVQKNDRFLKDKIEEERSKSRR